MTREDKLRIIAKRYLGDTEVEKVNALLKSNPRKHGLRMAIARLKGALDSQEYTEVEYQEEMTKQVLTATLGEQFRSRNNSKRKLA